MWVCLFRPFEVHMANKMNSFMDNIEIKLLFVVVFQYPCLLNWIERHQRTTVWKRLYCASRKMHKMLNKQLFLCHQFGEYMRHHSVRTDGLKHFIESQRLFIKVWNSLNVTLMFIKLFQNFMGAKKFLLNFHRN